MKGIDVSSPDEVSPFARHLATKWLGRQILFYRELSSTQDEAKRIFLSSPSGSVVWADRQVAGRGRLGRRWHSPRGAGLYFSIILKEPLAQPLPLYGLATALGLAEVLEKVTNLTFNVKWPNDVLLRGRKVAGILLEALSSALIIGIGVNVTTKRENFPPEIRDKATSIYEETGLSFSRAKILRKVLEHLEKIYDQLLEKGFEAIREQWMKKDITYGTRVVLKRADQMITGLALGPAPDGTLHLKTQEKIEKITSGEILLWEIPGWETRAA